MSYLRFIHASDIHLGAPFQSLTRNAGRREQDILGATEKAFNNLINLTIKEDVDFLILAGDVLDGSGRSYKTFRTFFDGMERLNQGGIPVYLMTGNHDPINVWQSDMPLLPKNVHVFPANEQGRFVYERNGKDICAIYGKGYRARFVDEDLTEDIKPYSEDPLSIGVLHTSLTAGTYAPTTPNHLQSVDIDYWALGHEHIPRIISENPVIAYSGSIQGLNRNQGPNHGCFLVEYDSPNVMPTMTYIDLAAFTWLQGTVDTSSVSHINELQSLISKKATSLSAEVDKPAVVFIELEGTLDIDDHIDELVLNELADVATSDATGQHWVWVASVKDNTVAPINKQHVLEAGLLPSYVLSQAQVLAGSPDHIKQLLLTELEKARIKMPDDATLSEALLRAENELLAALLRGDIQ